MRIRLVLYLEDSTNYCLPFCFTQDSCRSPLKSFLAEISYRHQGAPLCQARDQAAMTCTARVYTRKYSQLRLLLASAEEVGLRPKVLLALREKKGFS